LCGIASTVCHISQSLIESCPNLFYSFVGFITGVLPFGSRNELGMGVTET
jgi:hypothetical protein